MKIKKHTLYVGLNDKDTKTQLVNINKAKSIIADIVGDCTLSEATGIYTHENGEKVTETSIRVELLFKGDNEVISFCKQIKKELNQESIALVSSYENSTLI